MLKFRFIRVYYSISSHRFLSLLVADGDEIKWYCVFRTLYSKHEQLLVCWCWKFFKVGSLLTWWRRNLDSCQLSKNAWNISINIIQLIQETSNVFINQLISLNIELLSNSNYFLHMYLNRKKSYVARFVLRKDFVKRLENL